MESNENKVGGCINPQEFEGIADVYDNVRQWNLNLKGSMISDQQLAMKFD